MNLRLLQISDSALPIGGYTHSWGLEAALARRLVIDARTLESWTRAWLRFVLGPCEGIVVASSCRFALAQEAQRAGALHRRAKRDDDRLRLQRANDILRASINPPSVRIASLEMGE